MPGVRAKDMNAHYIGKKARILVGSSTFVGVVRGIAHPPAGGTKVTIEVNNSIINPVISGNDIVELL